MQRLPIVGAVFFFLGCGSNQFTSPDAATDSASDAPATIEGGMADAGKDGAVAPKPRLFASIIDMPGAVLAWDDPDSIAAPRNPDVTIGVPLALDIVAAKNKRLFVAGGDAIHVLDNPLALTSQSMPKSIGRTAFYGVVQTDVLSIVSVAYEPTLDILVTGDDGPSAMQVFKNASTMTIPTPAAAKIGTDMDDVFRPLLAPNGELYAGTGGYKTMFFEGAQNASGALPISNFVLGAPRLELGTNRLYVAGADLGNGGAAVYVYQHPVTTNMQSMLFGLNSAFGNPTDTLQAQAVVLSPTWLAVAAWKPSSMGSFVCVFANPSGLNASSSCANKIPIANNAMIVRLMERKGSLYVSVAASTSSNSRIEIYRAPLTDTKPTVSLDLGKSKIVSGFAVVE